MIESANLFDFIVYRCVVGSRAYGLENEDSDYDRRGIYLPPADLLWSLKGVPEQIENVANQETYWELEKFLKLALKSNPTILECLYTPLVEQAGPIAQELLAMRERFLSKLVYATYDHYVQSQFREIQAERASTGKIKWKQVMHLIRLLLSGITVMEEGYVPVKVAEHREHLLEIRQGRIPFEEVEKYRLELHRRFEKSFRSCKLPDVPDHAAANALLIRARRSML